MISTTLNFVPFLNKNDGTRLQMAMMQMRQALPLYKGERPLVETGYERHFEKFSENYLWAPYEAHVLYTDKRFIILLKEKLENEYDSELELIPLGHLMRLKVKNNDKVKQGDILAVKYDPGSKEEPKCLLDGLNLLTCIKMHAGYNYEDAVVLSSEAAKKMSHYEFIKKTIQFTENQIPLTLVEGEYKPFLSKGDVVHPDKPIAIIKNSSNLRGLELFKNKKLYYFQQRGRVIDVKYFINNYEYSFREFQKFITNKIEGNKQYLKHTIDTILNNYNKLTNKNETKLPDYITNAIQFYSGGLKKKSWKYKNSPVDILVEYTIMTLSPAKKGDKFANRHGNKGVNSNGYTIVDSKFMPKTKDGRTIDIIINIMGIPSRMNIGQIFELASSNIIYKLKDDFLKQLTEENIGEIKDKLKTFYKEIDYTSKKWITKRYEKWIDSLKTKSDLEYFLKYDFTFIAPSFESIPIDKLIELKNKYNVSEKIEIYDPILDQEVTAIVGYMFWMKLHHLASEKLAARSIGDYVMKTHQPTSGKKNKGGQRVGEMEIWNFISHELEDGLKEMLYTKSDDIKSKESVLFDILETGSATLPENLVSKISQIAETYLNTVNLSIHENNEEKGDN